MCLHRLYRNFHRVGLHFNYIIDERIMTVHTMHNGNACGWVLYCISNHKLEEDKEMQMNQCWYWAEFVNLNGLIVARTIFAFLISRKVFQLQFYAQETDITYPTLNWIHIGSVPSKRIISHKKLVIS
jgi:nitrate reductase alpha subunit